MDSLYILFAFLVVAVVFFAGSMIYVSISFDYVDKLGKQLCESKVFNAHKIIGAIDSNYLPDYFIVKCFAVDGEVKADGYYIVCERNGWGGCR